MKNIKVRTKLTIILALVIVLVTSESFISIKNMNQLKDKALETMDTSSRQNYDDSIKEQVGVVISLLSEINNEYKSGKYTLDEAKKIAADEIRQMRYGEADISGLTSPMARILFCLEVQLRVLIV